MPSYLELHLKKYGHDSKTLNNSSPYCVEQSVTMATWQVYFVCLMMVVLWPFLGNKWAFEYQKQVSGTETSNYFPHILWDVVIRPCPWYLLMARWRHEMETCSALLAFCVGNSPGTKGQWRGTLMLTLSCARIKGWINNREAGDLRRHSAHCDVIVVAHMSTNVFRRVDQPLRCGYINW